MRHATAGPLPSQGELAPLEEVRAPLEGEARSDRRGRLPQSKGTTETVAKGGNASPLGRFEGYGPEGDRRGRLPPSKVERETREGGTPPPSKGGPPKATEGGMPPPLRRSLLPSGAPTKAPGGERPLLAPGRHTSGRSQRASDWTGLRRKWLPLAIRNGVQPQSKERMLASGRGRCISVRPDVPAPRTSRRDPGGYRRDGA